MSATSSTDAEFESLGDRIRYARRLVGDLSARELDGLADLAKGHTALIESGVRSNVEAGTVAKLAEALGVSMDWLVRGIGSAPSKRSVTAAVGRGRARA